jgi:hypothetical protein
MPVLHRALPLALAACAGAAPSTETTTPSRVAIADTGPRLSEFAFELEDVTGQAYTGLVIDRLTTFDVAPICYQKMLDHDNGVLHSAVFYTRDVAKLARALTGDDWTSLETESVEPLISRFKDTFSMTIDIDGSDCDARKSALWLDYWTAVTSILEDNPPASGKAFVTLAVRADTDRISVAVDDDASAYTITVPRDTARTGWLATLEKPFRKRARRE